MTCSLYALIEPRHAWCDHVLLFPEAHAEVNFGIAALASTRPNKSGVPH